MVAVIKTGHSLRRIVNYNENKVKEGKAQCIAAGNYPVDVEKLTFNQKLNRLQKQAALNENVTRNSVHISLNFDPSEKFSDKQLQEIAATYLQKIGFGEQPFLVYQHHDSGHPHIHIVTVKVRADGSRIDMQNIGRNQSEKARKEIEQIFGLVRAEEHKQGQLSGLKPVNVQKAQYDRTETKRAITTVLDEVLKNYKYTSLHELNAVLKLYNVTADRGSENSRIFKNNGLLYRVLDERGNKTGVPIKASDFYSKPTLSYLQMRFAENEAARQPYKTRVKNAIDLAILKRSKLSVADLIAALQKERINTVVRQNAEGFIYGITYVDHRSKCVFNGSDLGRQYSAKAIQERCGQNVETTQKRTMQKMEKAGPVVLAANYTSNSEHGFVNTGTTILPERLLQPEHTSDFIPHQLKKKNRKKKKKHGTHL